MGGILRADGITLSSDGHIWTKGAGTFGAGWETTGTSISVQEGETIFIKFYSSSRTNIALCYTEHGRDSDSWKSTGPTIQPGSGDAPANSIILRISNIGTTKSSVMWMNGKRRSGSWSAFTATGAYDLALHSNAMWTLPPIIITKAPEARSFWADLFGSINSSDPEPIRPIQSVPDSGESVALLAMAILALATARQKLK